MKLTKLLISSVLTGLVSVSAVANNGDNAESEAAVSSKPEISTGKYITGGILGSAIGFGIGHAVQGRYGSKGWIFTAGDTAGALFLSTGFVGCWTHKNDNGDYACTSSDTSTLAVGYALSVGFHVWEIVDVWTGATPKSEEEPKVSLMVLPATQNQNSQFAFAYRF